MALHPGPQSCLRPGWGWVLPPAGHYYSKGIRRSEVLLFTYVPWAQVSLALGVTLG